MSLGARVRVVASCIGSLVLVAALAEPQEPPDDFTGGLARTEEDLGQFGNLGPWTDMRDASARKQAIRAYNLGLEYSDRAQSLKEQSATADRDRAIKKTAKAQKAYRKAIDHFESAIEWVPDFYQALGSLGYALLQTEQYAEALVAYDRALAIGPIYPEAIEERGEAYLGLDRIEDAKGAYRQLLEGDRVSAAQLMSAMKRWVAERRISARGLSKEIIEGFASWIGEQQRGSPGATPTSRSAKQDA